MTEQLYLCVRFGRTGPSSAQLEILQETGHEKSRVQIYFKCTKSLRAKNYENANGGAGDVRDPFECGSLGWM